MDLVERIKSWLWEATKLLALIVAVSVLVSILFGPSAPFFGSVLTNLEPVIATLGSERFGRNHSSDNYFRDLERQIVKRD